LQAIFTPRFVEMQLQTAEKIPQPPCLQNLSIVNSTALAGNPQIMAVRNG
jgi:hypothetical protein